MSIHFNRQAERSRRRSYKTIIFKEGGIILLIFLILFIILKKKFTRITKKQVNYTLEEIISIPASIERNARRTRKKKEKGNRRINPKILYIYMGQLSRSQNLQRWTNSKSKRHRARQGRLSKETPRGGEKAREKRQESKKERERERGRGLNGLWVRYSPTIEKRSVRNKRRATGR